MYGNAYDPETYPARCREYCEAGASIADLCKHFNVKSRQTIYNWANKYPEFEQALRTGSGIADDMAEHSMFRRVMGYEYTEVKTVTENRDTPNGKETVTRTEKIKKQVAPDVDAGKFWLKNRRPHLWKEKKEVTGEDGGPIPITLVEVSTSERPKPVEEPVSE